MKLSADYKHCCPQGDLNQVCRQGEEDYQRNDCEFTAEAHSCLTKSLFAANNADRRAYRLHDEVLLITCSYQGIANTFVQLRHLLVFDLMAAIPPRCSESCGAIKEKADEDIDGLNFPRPTG